VNGLPEFLTGSAALRFTDAAEQLARAEFRPAFAWQGPPCVVVRDGARVIGAGWTYVGSDYHVQDEDVQKFDILVADQAQKRRVGKVLFRLTLNAARAAAQEDDRVLRVSVINPVVERWLAAEGFTEVGRDDDDWISYWE